MKLIVNPHKIQIDQSEAVNEKEINVSECEFEFADEITNDFVKEAYFTLGDKTYKQVIVNNKCSFPQEVLTKPATIELGVVAYLVEDEEEIKRYNPTPVYFKTDLGSLKTAQNSEPITPSEMEQYEQTLQDGLVLVNSKIDDINTALTQVDNLDIDANKSGGISTVTITNKAGTSKTVQILDGINGTNGKDGVDGKDGKDGRDGVDGKDGKDGKDGTNGTNGTNGRDGYVQYTAGENITIENNVISATGGGASYTAGEGITISNDKISSTMPIYLIQDNSQANPFVIEDCNLGIYIFGSTTKPYFKPFKNVATIRNDIELINGYIIITNSSISSTSTDFRQKIGYVYLMNTYSPASYGVMNASAELMVRTSNCVMEALNGASLFLVPTSGNTTINGLKTFTTLPECSSTPSSNNQLANKKYVDNSITSAITTTLGGDY